MLLFQWLGFVSALPPQLGKTSVPFVISSIEFHFKRDIIFCPFAAANAGRRFANAGRRLPEIKQNEVTVPKHSVHPTAVTSESPDSHLSHPYQQSKNSRYSVIPLSCLHTSSSHLPYPNQHSPKLIKAIVFLAVEHRCSAAATQNSFV